MERIANRPIMAYENLDWVHDESLFGIRASTTLSLLAAAVSRSVAEG